MVLTLVGCKTVTGSMDSYEEVKTEQDQRDFEGQAEFNGVTISAVAHKVGGTIADIDIEITNKFDKVVIFNVDNSNLVINGTSNRVVVGETKKINSDLQQPTFTIAPNSSLKKTLCNPRSTDYLYGWVFDEQQDLRLSICLNVNGEDAYIDIELSTNESKISYKEEKIGEVQAEFTKWHIFFLGSDEFAAANALLKQARKQYGDDTWIKNIKYEANWSPLSLVLYCDLFGYVRQGNASADVYHWVPIVE